jgi:hypothetical protein
VRRSELSVRGNPVCHSLRLHSLSFLKVVARYSWIRVSQWGAHKCVGISSMLSVSEVWKNKLYLSFI